MGRRVGHGSLDYRHLGGDLYDQLQTVNEGLARVARTSAPRGVMSEPNVQALERVVGARGAQRLVAAVGDREPTAIKGWLASYAARFDRPPYPPFLSDFWSASPLRRHHQLWHFVRTRWDKLEPDVKTVLNESGWRGPSANPELRGLEFLAMNRRLRVTSDLVCEEQGARYRVHGWNKETFPVRADHPIWPMPVWERDEQPWFKNDVSARLMEEKVKTIFFEPKKLQELSLGQLGDLLEKTLRNWLQMRFSELPPEVAGSERDWMGSTYGTLAQEHFWMIVGTVDDIVRAWADANDWSEAQTNDVIFSHDSPGPMIVTRTLPVPELDFTSVESERRFDREERNARERADDRIDEQDTTKLVLGLDALQAWDHGFFACGPETIGTRALDLLSNEPGRYHVGPNYERRGDLEGDDGS